MPQAHSQSQRHSRSLVREAAVPCSRRQWLAIAAGLIILVGATRAERAAVDVLERPAPVVEASPQEARHLLKQRMVRALELHNTRLPGRTSGRIADAVLRCSDQRDLTPDLVLAVLLVESNGRPHAHSPKGALGLMQVMPYMYEKLDLPGHAAHIETNIEAGCMLLADNIERWGEEGGISRYFWGVRIRGDRYLRRVQSARRTLEMHLAGGPAQVRG